MLQFTSYVDGDGKLTAIGERVVADHMPLANKLAHGVASKCGASFDDLSGAAYLGLVRAAQSFDPTRGFTFGTYARHWILCFLRDEARQIGCMVRRPRPVTGSNKERKADISLDAPLGDDGETTRLDHLSGPAPDAEAALAESDETWRRRQILHEALATLTERERAIIEARHGDGEAVALADLGARFGISAERVRQIEAMALDKITRRIRAATHDRRPRSRYQHNIDGLAWSRDNNDNESRRAISCAFTLSPTTCTEFDARMRERGQ